MRDIHSVSVSLGTKALPEVREAVAHAREHPDHDPIVYLHVNTGRQEVRWYCRECAEKVEGDGSA